MLYLNVERRAGSAVNGVLFVVSSEELARFDAREWIYERVEVTRGLDGIHVDGGTAWVYSGRPEHLLEPPASPAIAAVRRSYLETLREGHRELGAAFERAYAECSDPVPEWLAVADMRLDDIGGA